MKLMHTSRKSVRQTSVWLHSSSHLMRGMGPQEPTKPAPLPSPPSLTGSSTRKRNWSLLTSVDAPSPYPSIVAAGAGEGGTVLTWPAAPATAAVRELQTLLLAACNRYSFLAL